MHSSTINIYLGRNSCELESDSDLRSCTGGCYLESLRDIGVAHGMSF